MYETLLGVANFIERLNILTIKERVRTRTEKFSPGWAPGSLGFLLAWFSCCWGVPSLWSRISELACPMSIKRHYNIINPTDLNIYHGFAWDWFCIRSLVPIFPVTRYPTVGEQEPAASHEPAGQPHSGRCASARHCRGRAGHQSQVQMSSQFFGLYW